MLSVIRSGALVGVEALPVDVEINTGDLAVAARDEASLVFKGAVLFPLLAKCILRLDWFVFTIVTS
jgi:hypothetical protein